MLDKWPNCCVIFQPLHPFIIRSFFHCEEAFWFDVLPFVFAFVPLSGVGFLKPKLCGVKPMLSFMYVKA